MDPGLLDAIGKLSSAALLAGGVIALATRIVYTRGEVRDLISIWKERLAERTEERDEWRDVAKSALAKVDRLTDVVETYTGRKIHE